jgi:hypothetical protein
MSGMKEFCCVISTRASTQRNAPQFGHTESPGGRETFTSDDAPQISQRIGVPSSVVVEIILDRTNDSRNRAAAIDFDFKNDVVGRSG